MFETTIAGSLPKPGWLAETKKLWPAWRAEGEELAPIGARGLLGRLEVFEARGVRAPLQLQRQIKPGDVRGLFQHEPRRRFVFQAVEHGRVLVALTGDEQCESLHVVLPIEIFVTPRVSAAQGKPSSP